MYKCQYHREFCFFLASSELLWRGKDKTTRLSAINTLEEGGIKMIDIESMIKALRLAWSKRIFNNNDSSWKFYLIHLLKQLGDL